MIATILFGKEEAPKRDNAAFLYRAEREE